MKKYNHTKPIILKKFKSYYINVITNEVISSDLVLQYKDIETKEYYYHVPIQNSINKKYYSYNEFHSQFTKYIDRKTEIFLNNRIYPQNIYETEIKKYQR